MQSGGAVRQSRVPLKHGVDGLQVPMARQRPRGDPHLVVVAVLQYHHGDGAEGAASRGPRVCLRSRRVCVALHRFPEVASPLTGHPAFPGRQATVRRDVEGIGPQLWRGSFSASGAWCRSGRLAGR